MPSIVFTDPRSALKYSARLMTNRSFLERGQGDADAEHIHARQKYAVVKNTAQRAAQKKEIPCNAVALPQILSGEEYRIGKQRLATYGRMFNDIQP